MALSARQRIHKLRETEFKLTKLHNDIITGEKGGTAAASMSEFLEHHQELMSLPGSMQDSVPFSFGFEPPRRYAEISKTQRLTLPPKLDTVSSNRLRHFKDPIEEIGQDPAGGLKKHPSFGLHTLLHQLELTQQGSKSSIGFPKVDKFALTNKAQYSAKSIQPLNSKRYVGAGVVKKTKSISARNKSNNNISPTSTSYLYLRDHLSRQTFKEDNNAFKSKSRLMNMNSTKSIVRVKRNPDNFVEQASKIASATASVLLASRISSDGSNLDVPVSTRPHTARSKEWHLPKDDEALQLKNSLAYGLGTAHLMGVILPSDNAAKKKKRLSVMKAPKAASLNENPTTESLSMTATEAVNLLRKRKMPERKPLHTTSLLPHERGLVGVEISEFLPHCAFFYRDRNGNYNPHLPHSKAVTESMKKQVG